MDRLVESPLLHASAPPQPVVPSQPKPQNPEPKQPVPDPEKGRVPPVTEPGKTEHPSP